MEISETKPIQRAPSCGDACITPVASPNSIGVATHASGLAAHVKVFKALGDDTRLRILEQLATAGGPLCACNIEGCCDLSQPTISHHLKVLREAGLIVGERRGTWIYYTILPETVRALPVALQRLVG